MKLRQTMYIAVALVSILTFGSPLFAKKAGVKISSAEKWLTAKFFQDLFAAEYLAVLNLSKDNPKNRSRFFQDPISFNLWLRASFAYLSPREGSLLASIEKPMEDVLTLHAQNLARAKTKQSVDTKEFLNKNDRALLGPKLKPQIEASFVDEQNRAFWLALADSFDEAPPKCANSGKDLKNYAALLENKSEGERQHEALQFVNKWESDRLECLIVGLSQEAPAKELTNDSIWLLNALAQASSVLYQSRTVRLAHAQKLFQRRDYAESLRLLMSLQEETKAYRLFYELAQRVYSLNNQGKGEVALRQNL